MWSAKKIRLHQVKAEDYLVRVIIPRIRKHKIKTNDEEVSKDEVINPTFFAGISQFKNSDEYAIYLKSIAKDEDRLYEMFASQVFALGNINQRKNENVRLSLFFFITGIKAIYPIYHIFSFYIFYRILLNFS